VKKKIIFCSSIIGIISFIYLVNGRTVDNGDNNLSLKELEIQEENEIIELKNELGITGKLDIYTIDKEYDGRKILVIKPNIQYNIVMAGILNSNKPDYDKLGDMLKNEPKENGIWISEKSRNQILEVIHNITKAQYTINENGYLKQDVLDEMNEYDKKIKKILEGDRLYVIDINKTCYIIDNVTGEIVENLFEEIDPYTPFEYFETNSKAIFIITTNSKSKLNYNDIIKGILESISV